MSKLKLGINHISNEDYHADSNFLSSSGLKTLLRDKRMFHKKYILKEKTNEFSSSAMHLGSFIHSLVLEPDLTDGEFSVYTGTRRGKDWEAFKGAQEGKTIITKSQQLTATSAVDNLFEHDKISSLLAVGTPELSLCAEIEEVPIKVRADFLAANGDLIDLKTTSVPMTKESLIGMICQRDYDLQAALYTDAFAKHTGEVKDFYFVFMSTKLPADTVAFKCGQDLLENGRRKYKKALKMYKECALDNSWEADIIEEIGLPPSERYE